MKNIIILILVLVNIFLLGALALRQTARHTSRRQTEEQLIALFAADGITLEENAISHKTPPSSLSLPRDTAQERSAAVFFLGEDLQQEDQGGGTSIYTGSSGTARFRSNGSFDIELSPSGQDPLDLCRAFCQDFSLDDPVFTLDDEETGSGVALYRYEKLLVFNASVTFEIQDGALCRVSGTLLPKSGTAISSGRDPLSAAAALTAFQNMLRETFTVVSAVKDMYLCYELQNASSSTLTLAPAWCVVTDTAPYYVNAVSGVVSTG